MATYVITKVKLEDISRDVLQFPIFPFELSSVSQFLRKTLYETNATIKIVSFVPKKNIKLMLCMKFTYNNKENMLVK